MRTILLIAIVALAFDAIKFSGAYSQAAWNAVTLQAAELGAELDLPDVPEVRPEREDGEVARR